MLSQGMSTVWTPPPTTSGLALSRGHVHVKGDLEEPLEGESDGPFGQPCASSRGCELHFVTSSSTSVELLLKSCSTSSLTWIGPLATSDSGVGPRLRCSWRMGSMGDPERCCTRIYVLEDGSDGSVYASCVA